MTEAEQNRLIVEHMPMVEPIAATYRGQKGIPFEDLASAGAEGLVKAARMWAQRASFSTYAVHKINSAIKDFIRDWQDLQGFEDDAEVERLWYEWTLSIYRAPYDNWQDFGYELPATSEELTSLFQEIAHRRTDLQGAFLSLDRRERAIVVARFIREPQQTLDSIAREHKISYARTVFLLKRALGKLKEVLDNREAKAEAA